MSSKPKSPVAAAVSDAAKPDSVAPAPLPPPKPDLPIFRINITMFIMLMTCVLLVIIGLNAGRTPPAKAPLALVFLVDGLSGVDVERAAARQRAPFIQMLADVGTSSIGMECLQYAKNDTGLVRELFFGSPAAGNTHSVLYRAIQAGLGVTVVGDYPLLDNANNTVCGALNVECPQPCVVLPANGGRCNYRAAYRQTQVSGFMDTTLAAFLAHGSQLVVVRIPVTPENPSNELSCDSALYLVDAALGRTAMAILERTAASGQSLLVVVAAANASKLSAYLSISAFFAAGKMQLLPMVSTPQRPVQLGDVAPTLAVWFGLPAQPFAPAVAQGVCGNGATSTNCVPQ